MNSRFDSRLYRVIKLLFTLSLLALMVFPLIWTAISSLKPVSQLYQMTLAIDEWSLNSYKTILTQYPFFRWILNSLWVLVVVALGNGVVNTMAAYALARIPFTGRNTIFILILVFMMIPVQIVMPAIYYILAKMAILNSYRGLTIPFLFSFFQIFLMRQFFLSIPYSLEESGFIDGASRFRCFISIIVPVAVTPILTSLLFVILSNWNSFFWPNLIAKKRDLYTLPVGLNSFKDAYFAFWDQILAGSVLVLLPAITLFLAFQKYMIREISSSGLKE